MNNLKYLLILSLGCFHCTWGQSTLNYGSKKIVWRDEFNHNGLPDSTKWGYEVGFVRDIEKEFYTNKRLENAKVENGNLVITGLKENYPNPMFLKYRKNYSSGDYPKEYKKTPIDSLPNWVRLRYDSLAYYTSASLITLNKASWKYGIIEIRAKLPKGRGVWPAIWMIGVNRPKVKWPNCGEIDIVEFVGKDSSHIFSNIHYTDTLSKVHKSSSKKLAVDKPYNDFHTYSIEWDSSVISFYFDNIKFHTFDISQANTSKFNPFREPFSLLINLALGGKFGGPIDDKVLPQQFLIDYVRVYQ